jgi:hypothetical protein
MTIRILTADVIENVLYSVGSLLFYYNVPLLSLYY